MKFFKYIFFSLLCMVCSCVVFAKDEVVIKSITPVYDETSTVLVFDEDNYHSVTFDENNQSVKYNVVIENTTESDLIVSSVDLSSESLSSESLDDCLIYEIEGIAKGDVLKSGSTQELVISIISGVKNYGDYYSYGDLIANITFEENVVNPNISFEENVINPNTSRSELITLLIVMVFIILISIFFLLLFRKQNNKSRYVALFVACCFVVPIINAATNIELQIKIDITFIPPELVQVVAGDGTKVGDELKIAEEHFYVLSNDGEEVVLLAKYNLEVGNVYNLESRQSVAIDNPSGLQSEKAIGLVRDGAGNYGPEYYGVVPFSSKNYWFANGVKEEYGETYPAFVYDDNSSIKKYVDDYMYYFKDLHLTVREARLITYEELVALGCSMNDSDCTQAPSWVYSTSYWTGSVHHIDYMWIVNTLNSFSGITYGSGSILGVRPVIVIPTFEL